MSERVIVGMSGGVDSSVAAYLLKLQGYEVIGVTMRIWDPDAPLQEHRDNSCCGETAVDDARRVCMGLGIPHSVISFRSVFEQKVIAPFVGEYLHGRTPNPCLLCNRYVKWEALCSRADALGARYVATGHYARILRLPNGRYTVRSAASADRDQTYALCRLTQEQLSRTLMPLGEYDKEQVRAMAAEAAMPVAHKPDSEDVCFISDGDYAGFVDRCAGSNRPGPGRFVYRDGTELGQHRGITHYTVGQRRGLGLSMGHHVFVTGLEAADNVVRIGEEEDIMSDVLVCRGINYMGLAEEELPVGGRLPGLLGRIRYRAAAVPCMLERTGEDELTAYFARKVRAVTPGQEAVFYEKDHILCAGTIAGTTPDTLAGTAPAQNGGVRADSPGA